MTYHAVASASLSVGGWGVDVLVHRTIEHIRIWGFYLGEMVCFADLKDQVDQNSLKICLRPIFFWDLGCPLYNPRKNSSRSTHFFMVHWDIFFRGGWQLALNLVDLPMETQEAVAAVALAERSYALGAQWQAAFWLWEEVKKKRVESDAIMLTSAISAYERGRLCFCFRGVQHPTPGKAGTRKLYLLMIIFLEKV